MGTQFTEIYQRNELLKNDNRLQGKTTNNIYNLYFQYLEFAIGFFQADCYKDLTQYTEFQQQEYYYTTNGTDNIFNLSPAPPSLCLFYVGKSANNDGNYTEITSNNYTYDSVAQTITISGGVLAANQTVYISGYIIGEFEETLSLIEKMILSEAMLIPWDQEQLHKNSLLNQIVYGGSQNMYAQSAHIQQVNNVVTSQYEDVVKSMISDYTYKYSPDKLKQLGGQLT